MFVIQNVSMHGRLRPLVSINTHCLPIDCISSCFVSACRSIDVSIYCIHVADVFAPAHEKLTLLKQSDCSFALSVGLPFVDP